MRTAVATAIAVIREWHSAAAGSNAGSRSKSCACAYQSFHGTDTAMPLYQKFDDPVLVQGVL